MDTIEEKIELIKKAILSTKIKKHKKFEQEAKDMLIIYYTETNKHKLKDISVDNILEHNFKSEIETGSLRLEKKKKLQSMVIKLEKHAYAPELNKLHFKSGKTFGVKGLDTMEDALIYASIHLSNQEIKLLENDFIKHFRV